MQDSWHPSRDFGGMWDKSAKNWDLLSRGGTSGHPTLDKVINSG